MIKWTQSLFDREMQEVDGEQDREEITRAEADGRRRTLEREWRDEQKKGNQMRTYRAKHLTGREQPDGTVVWIDAQRNHVGTTRNGDGYEVVSEGDATK